jgi:hypothetical protein
MEGYEVITSDEHKAGHVVGVEADHLIVEHGHVRKTRHAIPRTFAHADDAERVVRLSVSQEIVETSPKLEEGDVDHRAVAEHFGLAEGSVAPETLGEGDLTPDDPAWSAEQEELRTGVEPAPERRARMREGEAPLDEPAGRQIIPADPHERR